MMIDGQSDASDARMSHANAVDVINRILALLERAAAANSGDVGLPALLTERHFVRSLTDNGLLRVACWCWTDMSASPAVASGTSGAPPVRNGRRLLRGYIPPESCELTAAIRRRTYGGDSPPPHESCSEDPVHGIWRAALRSVASLLRSFRVDAEGRKNSGSAVLGQSHRRCLNSVIEFLGSYEGTILSCLYGCSFTDSSRDTMRTSSSSLVSTSSMATPSSGVAFTLSNLGEATDSLALVSELCSDTHRKPFERACPQLYRSLIDASLGVTRSLTSFLGSVGTARELFSALSSLTREGGEGSADGDPSIDAAPFGAAIEWHPLLADGIPSARHDAIRNAHFASGCCARMTAEDYALLLSALDAARGGSRASSFGASGGPVAPSSPSPNVERSFRIHVNNRFVVRAERFAAECLFHALSVLAETHPASSSFVYFSEEEAARLDSMSIVREGMIIALRLGLDSCADTSADGGGDGTLLMLRDKDQSSDELGELRFARVLSCNYLRGTWDVELVDDPSSQGKASPFVRDVSTQHLAGVEDLANRRCVFAYSSAPKLTSDAVLADDISVGHLILALRWCHQQAAVRGRVNDGEGTAVSKTLIRCLAERAVMMLGTEIGLHDELGTKRAAGDDAVRKVNSQLLELFDEFFVPSLVGESRVAGDGMESLRSRSRRGLRSVVEDEVWDATLAMLRNDLEAARREREEAQRQWEQGAAGGVFGGTSTWGSSVRRGGRRSPFRGFGGMGLR